MSNMVNLDDLTAFQTAMATKGFAIYPNGGGLSAMASRGSSVCIGLKISAWDKDISTT